jgi:PST family polysaccharide transporter
MGTSSLLVMALDVVRVKILALYLGPSGVGALAILNHFHVVVSNIVVLGLGPGIVKFISKYQSEDKDDAIQNIITTSFKVVFCLSLTALFLSLMFGSQLSVQLLGDPGHFLFIVIFACSFPMGVYPIITGSLLQGFKKIKSLAQINALRSLIALLIIVPLVYIYHLKGAVFSVLIVAITHLSLNYCYLKKEKIIYPVFKRQSFDLSLFRKIFPYGLTSFCVGSAYYLSHLVMKLIIVDALGLEMNGIYQPIWALSMTYLTLVLSSMSAYSFPRLCEISEDHLIVEELNGILRVALMLIVPAMFLLLLAREPIILLLYSRDFLSAADFMPVQILGDFFKVMWWSIGMFLLPRGRLTAFICLNLLQDVLLAGLAYILVKPYQLYGIAAAFSLSYLVALIVLYIYSKNKIKFRLWNNNRILISASFTALIILMFNEKLGSTISQVIVTVLVIGFWAIFSIKREEVLQLKRYITKRFLLNLVNKTAR